MKRIFCTALAITVPVVLWWLGGYDFDKRGEASFALGLTCLWAGFMTWFFPHRKD